MHIYTVHVHVYVHCTCTCTSFSRLYAPYLHKLTQFDLLFGTQNDIVRHLCPFKLSAIVLSATLELNFAVAVVAGRNDRHARIVVEVAHLNVTVHVSDTRSRQRYRLKMRKHVYTSIELCTLHTGGSLAFSRETDEHRIARSHRESRVPAPLLSAAPPPDWSEQLEATNKISLAVANKQTNQQKGDIKVAGTWAFDAAAPDCGVWSTNITQARSTQGNSHACSIATAHP